MDEMDVVFKARRWLDKIQTVAVPVSTQAYLAHLGAEFRIDTDLGPDEPGWSVLKKGAPCICVNANDSDERQRFTICHEIAHFVLGIKSEHTTPAWSYKKPIGEIYCDVFAAELLLPYHLFKPTAENFPIRFDSLDVLSAQFLASVAATGSRYAALISDPCAFVFSEEGKVRYASRSARLRECGAWIPPRVEVPAGSLSARIRKGGNGKHPEEVDADCWFREWERGGTLLEEARYHPKWDQTLTLLWFEDLEVPQRQDSLLAPQQLTPEDELLPELDGILRWKPRTRRR
jgi:hypothetical protein